MQRIVSILITALLVSTTLAMADPLRLVQIPFTKELRAERIAALEKVGILALNESELREIAMIYAVVAGTDDPRLKTIQKAEQLLSKALEKDPKDYEIMAGLGNVLTMYSRLEKSTAQKLHYFKKGTRLMDRALKKDPDNIGALLQRGNNSLHVPLFLKRAHYAKRDFEHLLQLVGRKGGDFFYAMTLFHLGEAHSLLKASKEARRYWQETMELKQTPWSEKAEKAAASL